MAELVLERVVADRVGLADQDLGFGRQLVAAVDGAAEGVEHVLAVEHRLADERGARIEMALEVALVDARDLLGERRHRRVLVVDAGEAQQHVGDLPVLGADHLLGRRLRFRIGPAGLDRLTLVDALARLAGRVHEHRARIDELLDLEVAAARAAGGACLRH